MEYFAPIARLPGRWSAGVRISVDRAGRITAVEAGARRGGAQLLDGCVIPGMTNLHSHAFQRAMRGLTQRRQGGDDFWSWREIMYACAVRLSPEDQHAVAARVFLEMLTAGYTGVVEFHYLHHGENGTSREMANALIDAARETGIRICLVPVLYTNGGFGGLPPRPEQARFVQSREEYAALVRGLARERRDGVSVGVAAHSLRAVTPEALPFIQALAEELGPEAPVHIHVAEQEKEVEDCVRWSGERPVRWLLKNAPVDRRWCLVHATHVDDDEIAGVAARGCVVGLCPTTEADLGDGIFPAGRFLAAGGRFGIGSDSQATVDPFAELRLLEYGQRLSLRRRNVIADGHEPHVGTRLWEAAVAGGVQASGGTVAGIAPGAFADLLVFDAAAMDMPGLPESLLDALVFAGGHVPKDVLVGGRRLVRDGRHAGREAIQKRYRETLQRLRPGEPQPETGGKN